MRDAKTAQVTHVPNQGWDPRILVCGYELAYGASVLPMYVFIVITQRYVVLIDTLVNEATARAMLELARPHRDGRGLLVVNTHADYDHAWGNQLFAAAGGSAAAPLIATRGCAERMKSNEAWEQLVRLQREQPDVYRDVRLCPPDILFDEALAIDGGDLNIRLFATPGHSPDHCSVFLPEIGTLLAGDAVEAPFPSPGEGGLVKLRESLVRLDALDAPAALYCHAPVWSGPELIRTNIEYFDLLEARCRVALANGIPAVPAPDADVEALVGFPYAQSVPMGMEAWAEEGFYRPGHRANIRAMLQHVV